DVLVIAHPSDPAWERTTGTGSPRLSDAELEAIASFVERGGGLIVLGETEQDKYGNNVNDLLAQFDLHLGNDTVQDYEHCHGAPTGILAERGGGGRGGGGALPGRATSACLYRATTTAPPAGAHPANGPQVLAPPHAGASARGAPLIAPPRHGRGRVVVLA